MKTNSVLDLPKCERPLKSKVRVRTLICAISKKNPFLISSTVDMDCHILKNVCLYYSQLHLHCWTFRKKGIAEKLSSVQNIQNREKVVEGILRNGTKNWRHLFFLMKVAFKYMQIYCSSNILYIRVGEISTQKPICVVQTIKYGSSSIMCGEP